MKTRTAAIVTIKDAPRMTRKGRNHVANWLEEQAAFLRGNAAQLSRRFQARYLYALVALGLVWGLSGCGTTPQARVQSVADIAQFCAYNASEALLIEKPAAEPGLRLAANQLRRLETADQVTMTEILTIIASLPADKLHSPYGRLAIANGTMLLTRLGRSVDVAQVDLKPIATGLRQGIEMRIGPPPAVP